jgi:hypothetical protein
VPEIGATLREARMRARIDISEIEAETKIRAKYLRALENEEWGLLPGPTYVRTFLRTYAEALGLDAKLLLEEYKLRHERPSDHDLMPIAPPRRRPPRPSRGVPRWVPIAGMVIALLAALFALGKLGGGGDGDNGTVASTPTSRTTTTRVPATAATRTTTTARTRKRKPAASPNVVRLQLVPTGEVFVCLQDASGKLVVNGATLRPGSTAGPFRSRKFTMRVGNGNLRLRLNGRTRGVGNGSPMGYIITRKAVTRVDPAKTPDCGRTG